MSELLKRWHELETFCAGCSEQCDKKCVIDNHEVEILQGPMEKQPLTESCCHNFRPDSLNSTSSSMCTAKLLGRSRTLSMAGSTLPDFESEYGTFWTRPPVERGVSLPGYTQYETAGSHLCTTR
mmetsp:Transcript_8113/g.19385  ORF Transcript_8113/g.19385 Transcript_8113/m.19385 type:complete len:124 (-) Transcript_8113:34-405(-)